MEFKVNYNSAIYPGFHVELVIANPFNSNEYIDVQFCGSDSDCGSGICFLFICAPPAPAGVPCTRDAECQSGTCHGLIEEFGICAACSKDSDCGSGEFCEDISKQCFPLLPKGLVCPDGDHSCATGVCHIICTDGCVSDAQCGAGYFCDTKVTELCLPTEGKGAPCVEDKDCTNTRCGVDLSPPVPFCVDCITDSDCDFDEFCFTGNCVAKVGNGAPCLGNDYCNSGKCALFCVQCLSDQDCPSQQFCIAGACAPQVGIGTPCLGDDYCLSGHCNGVCVQCGSDSDCGGGNFCFAGGCVAKAGNGVPCFQNDQCASGDCKGICLPGSCSSDGDCNALGNYFCFIGSCVPQAPDGTPCLSSDECINCCYSFCGGCSSCFPGDATATVQLALGPAESESRLVRKTMAQLAIGDRVQVVSRSGEVTYEDVWLFGHREQEASCSFTRIDISPVLSTTAPPQALTLSGDHFLPTGTPAGASGGAAWTRRVMRRARDVQPDMLVWALDAGGRSALFRVDNVTAERRTGFYNPFTASGTIIVDGVVASVQSKWFADDIMDRLGLTHAIPALYQAILWPGRLIYLAIGPENTRVVSEYFSIGTNKQPWVWPAMMGTSAAVALALLVRGASQLSRSDGVRRR